jgi:benzoyl-CoA reductase/2-hydroxyglutaryl-CoA dehydratase subunit BcrC/BadD/HgdB
MKKTGITTTVPVEVLLAAGHQPVDLNNIFISHPEPEMLLAIAERDGFPLNCCSWIKGIYGVCLQGGLDSVLCVTNGDCSNTTMLMEVLKLKGIKTTAFAYPEQPDNRRMLSALKRLAGGMGTTLEAAERLRDELLPARNAALELDRLTWQEGLVSGWENHISLVSTSDFNQDTRRYQADMETLITDCRRCQPYPDDMLRLAYIGVPPVFGRQLYSFLESNNARVVFNEVQRQFAMPFPGGSLPEQYANYTYPYSIHGRLKDIKAEIKRRRVDAVIHYVQAFCHRAIGDIILRQGLKVPILTLEGNSDFGLSQQTKTRLEAFLDIVALKRQGRKTLVRDPV